jgi:hypothetical protein
MSRIAFSRRKNQPPSPLKWFRITEHLERTGLGFRCNVEFRNSGSIKHILRVFKRYSYSENRLNKSLPNHICIGLFPDDVSRFYICNKSQGVHRNLTVQHNSTPYMQQIDLFPTMGATHWKIFGIQFSCQERTHYYEITLFGWRWSVLNFSFFF